MPTAGIHRFNASANMPSSSGSLKGLFSTQPTVQQPYQLGSPALNQQNFGKSSNMLLDHEFDGELANEISMDAFEDMMDTLTLQPRHNLNDEAEDEDDEDSDDSSSTNSESSSQTDELDLSKLKQSSKLHPRHSVQPQVRMATSSDIGVRDSQEDRYLTFPDLSEAKLSLNGANIDSVKHLACACIFDGHAGARSSEYLAQNILETLSSCNALTDILSTETIHQVFMSIDNQVRIHDTAPCCTHRSTD
jgi:hypothetical protein